MQYVSLFTNSKRAWKHGITEDHMVVIEHAESQPNTNSTIYNTYITTKNCFRWSTKSVQNGLLILQIFVFGPKYTHQTVWYLSSDHGF